MRLNNLQDEVEIVLADDPESRDSDITLYLRLCERRNPLAMGLAFEEVFAHPGYYGLPNYDSVTRCRRKLQEHIPAYRPSEKALGKRYEKWKNVRDYVAD